MVNLFKRCSALTCDFCVERKEREDKEGRREEGEDACPGVEMVGVYNGLSHTAGSHNSSYNTREQQQQQNVFAPVSQ